MKVKAVIELIENDGWFLVRTRGSHRQYKHSRPECRRTTNGENQGKPSSV
ncbi:MAG: addiction module toxin, HicA family [Candidatus Dadabacteria bacterium]|nr:MAG: addiction module toxin, HicA family [Candidatus Dadabacteria bacterium]